METNPCKDASIHNLNRFIVHNMDRYKSMQGHILHKWMGYKSITWMDTNPCKDASIHKVNRFIVHNVDGYKFVSGRDISL